MDGLCEVRACDHRSPTFAYGLTRFACRAAAFVAVDAMQNKNKCSASVREIDLLADLRKGPTPPAAGMGPRPRGGAQKRAVRPDNPSSITTPVLVR